MPSTIFTILILASFCTRYFSLLARFSWLHIGSHICLYSERERERGGETFRGERRLRRLIPVTEINAKLSRVPRRPNVRLRLPPRRKSSEQRTVGAATLSGLFNVSQRVVMSRIKTSASDKTCRLGAFNAERRLGFPAPAYPRARCAISCALNF